MELADYKHINPDTIYNDGLSSITFFYIPRTKEFFSQPYPTNHQEMLQDDEDVFNAVYPGLEDKIDKQLRDKGLRGAKLDSALEQALEPYKSRGPASDHAVLGRFGLLNGDLVVSLWRSVSDPQSKEAVEVLSKKFPAITKTMTVVTGADARSFTPEGKPVLLTDMLGQTKVAQKAIPDMFVKPKDSKLKKYKIGGHLYSLEDLAALRGTTHTKTNYNPMLPSNPFSVLCHPDVRKYPELSAYIPNCPAAKTDTPNLVRSTHPSVWRQKARELGQYAYDYGEFVKHMDSKMLYDTDQQQ